MKYVVTVAVVGAGGMGKTHLNNLKSLENVRVDAICDPNPATENIADQLCAKYYKTIEELLNNTTATLVMVFTPTFLHVSQIEAVLRSGRHCISEKPLCLSSTQASFLYSLADEKNVHLYVAHVIHFTKQYQMLTEMIQQSKYGKVIDAFFFRLSQKPQWLTGNWLFDPEKSGLIPYDLHIHDLDYIICLFGKPIDAKRQKPTVSANNQLEHYRFLYDYGDKTVCAEASWYNAPIPFTAGFRICFENAVVVYESNHLIAYERGEKEGKILMEEAPNNGTTINVSSSIPYRLELEHFIECMMKDIDSPVVRRENVIKVLEVLEDLKNTL